MTLYRVNLFGLFLLIVNGVFGVDSDEVKSVSVMEGHSVTLPTNVTELQIRDKILWMFGSQGTLIAEINKKSIDMDDSTEIFGDRLKLDSQTGSLIITNIRITNSGLYKLQIIRNRGTSYKRFNVTVYAHPPVPDIIRNCTSSERSSESSNCSVLCSVMNVTHDVSLSWYKGISLLSSISVSDLNIRLSLPLEVEYQDTNTYRCVVNNPITNQTQHLNITHVCQPCSDSSGMHRSLAGIISAVILAVLALAGIFILCKKHQRNKLNSKLPQLNICNRFEAPEHTLETSEEEVHYADTTFYTQNPQKKRMCESEVIYSSVMT